MNSGYWRAFNCILAPPSRMEAASHRLSSSAEHLTPNTVGKSKDFISSQSLLFTLLNPLLLLHSAAETGENKAAMVRRGYSR